MRILYIYPHPDDESFGPAAVMREQRLAGHEVYLLTLTKGGATKVRHALGLSVDQMGEVRRKEMECVEKCLDLSGMTVLDLPDGGLKELDPRDIEKVVANEVVRIRPHVIISYAVMGISGFADHVVTHAIVKRVFVDLKEEVPELQRFAMQALNKESVEKNEGPFRLFPSTENEIDCVANVSQESLDANLRALDCYESYRDVIEKTGIKENRGTTYDFEFFGEAFSPPVDDLFKGLSDAPAS